ncbi:putative metal-binding protein [Abditibacterium utsteinense]|uniref:Putative metal-binding protein n=1 Tax=Abditibacterium utsteinense TaxID=1960156 RepID=A0A2S8SUS1_9BACT|nr:DUF2227 family putative metal-binding protein [Abditibacterium utsteinense]PQV64540.1 putative metal-binding protein [Abditibacterium utsteinense]
MASGKVHTACSMALAAISFGAIAGGLGDTHLGAACAAGCIAGIFLTPDLDQEGLSHSENILIKATLGIGYLWLLLWYPYAKLIPHRSPLSHFPVLGTAIRLLYLGIWAAIPAYFGFRMSAPSPEMWPLLQWGIFGLALSDLGHFVFDLKWRF